MKKKQEVEDEEKKKLEIMKAVAQAWYGHSGSSRPISEFEAQPRNFTPKPSRFNLEAIKSNIRSKISSSTNLEAIKSNIRSKTSSSTSGFSTNWDFRESLWDSYEIVTVSKKLERGLMMDGPFGAGGESFWIDHKPPGRKRKTTLLSLFNSASSRRFNGADVLARD